MQKTMQIAGIAITLEKGRRYRSESPIATNLIKVVDESDQIVIQFEASGYEERCQFLNEFNNEAYSWTGRIW